MVVTDISLVGWLASAADGTRSVSVALAVINREAIAMDILVGIVMLAVAIVFVGIALDAARRK